MIRPPGFAGAAFGTAREGDARHDLASRGVIAAELGTPGEWAWPRQVHGATVVEALAPGPQGEADAVLSRRSDLAVTVATADCYPVVLEGRGAVAVAHAGWRGTVAGVAARARDAMAAHGTPAQRAAIGPGIGPCCYEVGPDVADRLPGFEATTTWGTRSVDLGAAVAAQLAGLEVWSAGVCTRCDQRFNSYRRDGTDRRQVAVAWLPAG